MGILKIGNRLFDGDQVISALVQYKLLENLVGQVVLDKVIEEVPLTQQDVFYALTGSTDIATVEEFQAFLGQWCQQRNMTPEYFSAVVLRELRIEKLKDILFADKVESEFLRNKLDFDQVEYSLIQLTDLLLAQELYFHLRDDDVDFGRLAQQYSLGSERETGGWIGPVSLSSIPSDIAMLFRSGKQGVVYGPVPIGERFWIVRLEYLATARLTDATRAGLMSRMYDQWLQTQVKTIVATPGAIAMQADAGPELAALPSTANE